MFSTLLHITDGTVNSSRHLFLSSLTTRVTECSFTTGHCWGYIIYACMTLFSEKKVNNNCKYNSAKLNCYNINTDFGYLYQGIKELLRVQAHTCTKHDLDFICDEWGVSCENCIQILGHWIEEQYWGGGQFSVIELSQSPRIQSPYYSYLCWRTDGFLTHYSRASRRVHLVVLLLKLCYFYYQRCIDVHCPLPKTSVHKHSCNSCWAFHKYPCAGD